MNPDPKTSFDQRPRETPEAYAARLKRVASNMRAELVAERAHGENLFWRVQDLSTRPTREQAIRAMLRFARHLRDGGSDSDILQVAKFLDDVIGQDPRAEGSEGSGVGGEGSRG